MIDYAWQEFLRIYWRARDAGDDRLAVALVHQYYHVNAYRMK